MAIQLGDQLPQFIALSQDGTSFDSCGIQHKPVVIYFYPKDNTPGCTAQACSFRDAYQDFQDLGAEVIGISGDSVRSHQNFQDKYKLPFRLVADEEKTIVADYGLWGEKKFMGKTYMGTSRVTFLIDEKGKIVHMIEKVDTKNHSAQILAFWG